MPRHHQFAEMPQEQGAQQRGDVQAIRIGVGKNAYLVVTQPVEAVASGIDAERYAYVVHFLRCKNLPGIHFPGIQDLAAQRHDRLRRPVASLLGGPAGRITFDEEDLAQLRLLRRTVGEFAGQRRAGYDFLADDLLGRFQTLLGLDDSKLRELVACFRMLIEPDRKVVLDDSGDERGRLPRRQPLLCLSRELRILELRAEDEIQPVPNVFRRDRHAAR